MSARPTWRARGGRPGRRRALPGLLGALGLLGATGCGGEGAPPAAAPDPPRTGAPAAGATAPGGAAAGTPWLVEEAAARGLVFTHRSGASGGYLMPEIMGGGAALLDADGDGDLDAYLVQGGSPAPAPGEPGLSNQLFRNDGAGRFEDVTGESGAGDRGYGMGVACGDVDDDGDVDLYVTNVGANALLLNRGDGRFEDATAASGTGHPGWGTSASFLDYDRDGRLDLFVVNYLEWNPAGELPCVNSLSAADYCSPKVYDLPSRDVLYHNEGGGRLRDVTEESGVAAELGTGLGIACGDFDGDGWSDVFVANDGMPNLLWANRGGARFENVAHLAGCAVDENGTKKAGMGVAVGDVNDDGTLDLLVCNLNRETDSLFLNQGGTFRDRTSRAGLAVVSKTFTRFGMGWVDFDQDGHLDLFQANGRVNRQAVQHAADPYAEPDLLYRGSPGPRFEEVLPRGGTRELLVATGRAAAFGDVDGDGGIDVLVVNRDAPAHLLLNRAPRGRWVLLRVLERSGRDALGATVTASVGERTQRRDVRAGYSYLASNDPRVHFGLGAHEALADVVVTWADGQREGFGTRAAGAVHELRRGTGTPLHDPR